MPPRPGQLSAELLDAAVELMGRSGRCGTVRVQGKSMLPTLREGQLLAVEFAPARVARGDLLLFRKERQLIVHRLLGRARLPGGGTCLRTRGDGVLALDPPLDPSQVVGRVVAIEEGGTWRSTRGVPARSYAWCLAWHDLVWSGASVVAGPIERGLARCGLAAPLAHAVGRLDRTLLAVAHRRLFRRLHAAVGAPAESQPKTEGRRE